MIKWLSGGELQYHTFSHCLRGDWVTLAFVVCSGLVTFVAYLGIAWVIKFGQVGAIVDKLIAVFLSCGALGYGFFALKVVWPAWRLFAMLLFLHCLYSLYTAYLGLKASLEDSHERKSE